MTNYDHQPDAYWTEPPEDDVVIASVLLESTLSDVIMVTAAPAADGRIRFGVRDEYEGAYTVAPEYSDRPLSMRELIELIDGAEMSEEPEMARGLVYGALAFNSLVGSGDATDANFVSVRSEFYPELDEHYRQQAVRWVLDED